MIIFTIDDFEMYHMYKEEDIPSILRKANKVVTEKEFLKIAGGKKEWWVSIAEHNKGSFVAYHDILTAMDIKDLLEVLKKMEGLLWSEDGWAIVCKYMIREGIQTWGITLHIESSKFEKFTKKLKEISKK